MYKYSTFHRYSHIFPAKEFIVKTSIDVRRKQFGKKGSAFGHKDPQQKQFGIKYLTVYYMLRTGC